MTYKYEAMNSSGRTVTGTLESTDSETVVQQLRGMGYFPTRVCMDTTKNEKWMTIDPCLLRKLILHALTFVIGMAVGFIIFKFVC